MKNKKKYYGMSIYGRIFLLLWFILAGVGLNKCLGQDTITGIIKIPHVSQFDEELLLLKIDSIFESKLINSNDLINRIDSLVRINLDAKFGNIVPPDPEPTPEPEPVPDPEVLGVTITVPPGTYQVGNLPKVTIQTTGDPILHKVYWRGKLIDTDGPTFTAPPLTGGIGNNRIQVVVEDANGNKATAELTITIKAP